MPIKPWIGFVGVVCATLAMGCGNTGLSTDGALSDDQGNASDLSVPLPAPDLSVPAPPPDLTALPDLATSVGIACPTGNECPAGFICLGKKLSPLLPPDGFCTRSCTVDNDCGASAFCGPAIPNLGQICFANCDANGTCAAANRVCSRRLDGTTDLVKSACIPGNPAARDGTACQTFGDCNSNQACLDNAFEAPGGECVTIGCKLGDNTTCAPGGSPICVPFGPTSVCVPGCAMSSDCRNAEGYQCVMVNQPGLPAGVCVYPHKDVGSACTKDGDCGLAGSPWRCLPAPGGYCSGTNCDPQDPRTCPSNSACVTVDPQTGTKACLRSCATVADCRGAEGYKCIQYDPNQPNARICSP